VAKKSAAASDTEPDLLAANGKEEGKAARKPVSPGDPFIVGIGASAGGLDAFEQFFTHLPPNTGMVFVLVPHLDPTHKGMMPELIQRHSKMPVVEITDGITVKRNTVYVIPPNADLSILHGTLVLSELSQARGLRTPIDSFFKSLALDQDGRAIGVVLSGMGTDGTHGIRTIKEHNGLVMVQDPDSAKYPSMPQSAIATHLADVVAPVEELPAKLIEYAKTYSAVTRKMAAGVEKGAGKMTPALQKIFTLLRSRTGHDFSLYKRSTICRRIERRMGIHQLNRIADYVRYLQENPKEVEILFNEILIGVTGFFREPEAWEALKRQLIQHFETNRPEGRTIRVWAPGCSTGEEAYTLAMVLVECLDVVDAARTMKIQIFATDIDRQAIDTARQGVYLSNIASDVSAERLNRFLIREDDRFRVKQEVRDLIVFAQQDLIMDPPFTRLDLVCCRNLLIYFTPGLQRKALQIFHYALCPGSILFLGSAESAAGSGHLFQTLDSKWKIFQRQEVPLSQRGMLDLPLPHVSNQYSVRTADERRAKERSISTIAPEVLLEHFAPPAIFITRDGDIVYFHGKTGTFLEPAAGKPNLNIYAMARQEIRTELVGAIHKALREKRSTTVNGVRVKISGQDRLLSFTVTPVQTPASGRDIYMVVFEEASVPSPEKPGSAAETEGGAESAVCAALEEALREAKGQLQATIEENQATQEEMRSMNEELQSANEELQSTNEELISSKEEFQSLNEELTTVNAELQAKIADLSASHNDLRNVLNSTEIGVLLLDANLHVRRYTPETTKIVNLIPSDLGRPITDLSININHENLAEDARSVLNTLQSQEKLLQTPDGHWYSLRILPYRTINNVIDGVIITFSDVTTQKEAEISAREARAFADHIIATIREPLIVLDTHLKIVLANQSFYRTFQVDPKETEGHLIYTVGNNQWDIPRLRRLLEDILLANSPFEDFDVEHDFPQIGRRIMRLNARKIQTDRPERDLVLLAIEDVTPPSQKSSPIPRKRSRTPT
jgi:two-component system, chemotaxis family, CheB/CheR fusion protein